MYLHIAAGGLLYEEDPSYKAALACIISEGCLSTLAHGTTYLAAVMTFVCCEAFPARYMLALVQGCIGP